MIAGEIFISMLITILMLQLSNPFKLSISLLVLSVTVSATIIFKTASVWIPSIILLTFSSGMMVLFSYASSLSPLDTTKKEDVKGLIKLLPLFLLIQYTVEMELRPECFMKEFTSGFSLTVTILVLILFIIPIMENCFNPITPMQSSF